MVWLFCVILLFTNRAPHLDLRCVETSSCAKSAGLDVEMSCLRLYNLLEGAGRFIVWAAFKGMTNSHRSNLYCLENS